MIHQMIFTNDSVQETACGCNFQMGDGSVRAAALPPRPVSLQALSLALRRVGPRAEAHAYGVQGPVLRSVWMALQHTGLPLGRPTPRPSAGPQPVLMVLANPAVAGSPGAAALFIVIDGPGPVKYPGLLLPAVQSMREGARRATRGGALGLVLVQAPGAAQGSVPHDTPSFNFTRVDMN